MRGMLLYDNLYPQGNAPASIPKRTMETQRTGELMNDHDGVERQQVNIRLCLPFSSLCFYLANAKEGMKTRIGNRTKRTVRKKKKVTLSEIQIICHAFN